MLIQLKDSNTNAILHDSQPPWVVHRVPLVGVSADLDDVADVVVDGSVGGGVVDRDGRLRSVAVHRPHADLSILDSNLISQGWEAS